MTKRVHPAESARKLVGVASGVALVGIVTGFQLSANAQESQIVEQASQGNSTAVVPVEGTTQQPTPEAVPEAVPAPAAPAVQEVVVPEAVAPAAPAPVEAPAPAVVAPAPAPAAPVNGTTAGSGG